MSRDLNLGFRNFFNKDPGHWIPACVGVITSAVSGTISDPESHAHLALVDVVAVPLNMADAMETFTTSFIHVYNTVNWKRTWTFSTVESEIPAFATAVTAGDSKNASPVNMEGSVREVLGEQTLLWNESISDHLTRFSFHSTIIVINLKLNSLKRLTWLLSHVKKGCSKQFPVLSKT